MGEILDSVSAGALAAAAVGAFALRRFHRRTHLVDGVEAVGVAVVGVTVAAASGTPSVIVSACAIAFAAIVQQYAALVHASIQRRPEALVGAPIGFAINLGFIAYFLLGRPALLVIALACWALVECTWTSIVRGLSIRGLDRERPRAPVLPALHGGARWRRLGEGIASSRDTAFWGLVVARPLARVVLQALAEQRWLTPNRITIASIVLCFVAAGTIATGGSVVLALVCIGIRSILDSMDGQLARYRACGTHLGSYVDKVSDLYCWGGLFLALGVRAYAMTQATPMLVLPLVAAIVLALFGFALWLARALASRDAAVPPPARVGMRAWVKSLWRIVLFEEPDFYLWIALAYATARYDLFVPFIAGAYVLRALVLGIVRAGLARSVFKESPA